MFPIEQLDTTTAPEEKLRALHDLYLEWDAERRPHDPEVPWEQRLADWRHPGDYNDIPRWAAWDGDAAIASSGVYLHKTQDLDNAWGWAFVAADRRGKGMGKLIARESVSYALRAGRKRYGVGVEKDSPYGELPVRAGMKPVYDERVSQLRISDVDHDLMRSWIERSAERAGDYELLFFGSPVPEEYLPQMINVMEVMDTAPLEDLEEDPFRWDEVLLREVEEREAVKGRIIHFCVASHKPTGDFVGYTSLVYQSLHPAMAHQWDTGVDPKHRNLGLGRWLKAAMLEEFLTQHPGVEIIETENADSNEPMLNINVAMGFKPALADVIYQGELEEVARYFGL